MTWLCLIPLYKKEAKIKATIDLCSCHLEPQAARTGPISISIRTSQFSSQLRSSKTLSRGTLSTKLQVEQIWRKLINRTDLEALVLVLARKFLAKKKNFLQVVSNDAVNKFLSFCGGKQAPHWSHKASCLPFTWDQNQRLYVFTCLWLPCYEDPGSFLLQSVNKEKRERIIQPTVTF